MRALICPPWCRKGNVNQVQSDRQDGASTKHFLNLSIEFCLNNDKSSPVNFSKFSNLPYNIEIVNFILSVETCTCPNFTKFSAHVTCGCDSIFLWWQCNMIHISGFVDDVMFSHNGTNGPKSSTTSYFVQFARWRYRRRSYRPQMHACYSWI